VTRLSYSKRNLSTGGNGGKVNSKGVDRINKYLGPVISGMEEVSELEAVHHGRGDAGIRQFASGIIKTDQVGRGRHQLKERGRIIEREQ